MRASASVSQPPALAWLAGNRARVREMCSSEHATTRPSTCRQTLAVLGRGCPLSLDLVSDFRFCRVPFLETQMPEPVKEGTWIIGLVSEIVIARVTRKLEDGADPIWEICEPGA